MKLSNKGRYGIQALFDIAYYARGGAAQSKDISERQGIPARFLEQIFQDLKKAGLVASKRGPRGGYQLARPPEEIRVGDIIRALEGPVTLAGAGRESARSGDDPSHEITQALLRQLSSNIEDCFDAVTLEDLCERGEEAGLRRSPPRRYVYSI